MNQVEFDLRIEGMSCGGCVRRVTAALKGLEGVVVDSVEVGRASGHFEGGDVVLSDLLGVIERLGFRARPDEEVGQP